MEITDKLTDEMPEVQEEAIDQLQAEKNAARSKLRDSMGRAFDAALHIIDEATGEPILTKKGELRIKRGKGPRAKKQKISSIGGLGGDPGAPPLQFAEGQSGSEAEILATGQSAASLTFIIGMAVFGSDGKPSNDEINQVTYAYQTYFRAKNIRDLPPGVVLVTALATYTVPRLMKPKQAKRINTLWSKIRSKWSKRRSVEPESKPESPFPETDTKGNGT